MDVREELLEHLERHLGTPVTRFDTFADGRKMRCEVLRFADRPVRGASTHVTLGLSAHPFAIQQSQQIREELVFTSWQRFDGWDSPALLHGLAQMIIARDTAVIRGQVLDVKRPVLEGSTLTALYFTPPPYFPESFDYFAGTVPPTLFVGVVPVSRREAQLVAERGWSRFEDALAIENPDLLDLTRPGLTLAAP